MVFDRSAFLAGLAADFPEVLSKIGRYEKGLLHCEVAVFRQATEKAIDSGQLWTAEKHFRFVDRTLKDADAELRNALEISYLEDFALGECTAERYQAVKERMPKALRRILIKHHAQWQ